jgi:Ca2+-transporting ATPase
MNWYNENVKKLENEFNTNIKNGINKNEAENRLIKYGKNELTAENKGTLFKKIIEQFKDVLIIILIIAGLVSFFVGEEIDAIIIMAIVILNATMGIVQESKAEKSLEALKKMTSPNAKVIRDGAMEVIKASDIVPGDIVSVEAGDFIPADGRLIEAINLKIEESALTGESVPVEKHSEIIEGQDIPLGDKKNMVFSSTVVTYGRGEFMVTETGMSTEVGKIANMINKSNEISTPLQKKLAQFGKILGLIALGICILIFVIGLLEGRDFFDMFLTAVSLAVAAIPEGLPAIVTIVLAIGVQRLVKHRAVVRKLPAVETLGSATVICSDKTGTLTQNKMTLLKIADTENIYDINMLKDSRNKALIEAMTAFSIANNSELVKKDDKWDAVGDPTETALTIAAANYGLIKSELEEEYAHINELPFDSVRKMMSSINNKNDEVYIFTKGAPDELLRRCKYYMLNDEIKPLTDEVIKKIEKFNSDMGKNALRVLGAAYRKTDKIPEKIDSESVEKDLVFLGLAGMIDPPREEVKEAIRICKGAGIRTVMITGDHSNTATAIARELGILGEGHEAVSGTELSEMTQEDLNNRVQDISVYARVSPEHKVRIVKAWQSRGEIVAMTGDGVNDAPALKNANIGCAMGITGTDVAKGAADMVLTDDNFTTIVEAVHEGRGIFDNIKKSIHFLLSCNLGEIFAILFAIIMNWATPLIPIQILWVNLITDSFPAIALGMEPVDPDIMKRKPGKQSKGIFADGLGLIIGLQGLIIGIVTITAFLIGLKVTGKAFNNAEALVHARTMAFATLAVSQLIHAFNVRSSGSIFRIGIFSNKWMIRAFLLSFVLQISVIMVPFLSKIFKVVNLSINEWLIVGGLSLAPLIIVEIMKFITKHKQQ